MREAYDVIVVDAGHAWFPMETLAEAVRWVLVLLVEKRPAIGVPVRCAEGRYRYVGSCRVYISRSKVSIYHYKKIQIRCAGQKQLSHIRKSGKKR